MKQPFTRTVRRLAIATTAVTAATGMALALAAPAQAARPTAAEKQSVRWLGGQLTDGVMHNDQYDFDDIGLTLDAGLALAALDKRPADVEAIQSALGDDIEGYTTYNGDVYAGSVAKALAFTTVSGGDYTDVGGVNLRHRLHQLVIREGSSTGRIADHSDGTDYANTIGQAFAVQGLSLSDSGQAKKVIRFLLKQQCDTGYFRLQFNDDKDAKNQGCGGPGTNTPSVDVTALAVIALQDTHQMGKQVRSAQQHAVAWLLSQQGSDGSFAGAPPTDSANTNSTGLASWALGSSGVCRPARQAAVWVRGLEVPPNDDSALADETGAIAYDAAAYQAGESDGITTATRDQWRRASAQAAPALRYLRRSNCA
ncbi:terpene cyclase/mutase family protein [Nocardioides acrostichi]|uniref:Terpene cyclase/mutase family protein n=1 Tax=Nocardioides acrostichi TaxID=2784339 RepID=A0A930UYB4_9ACTN|nr:terpene cyclase/mutase family protein [Nocardioides acrostichi]MBF4160352.1 terpene cyclase/mutase family protein [Nocardioides acrostichi]